MTKRLLLHHRADCNTNDIWRAAIRAGWSTERVSDHIHPEVLAGADKIRYYGNTLHASRIEDKLPFAFLPLDLKVLATTPLTKRAVWLCKMSELHEYRFRLTGSLQGAFIKPAQEKWFPARVYGPTEAITGGEEGNTGSLPDDMVYVQAPVTFINEVRCFCLDGEILTSSYYRISKEYCPLNVDEFRPGVIDAMVRELAPSYPRGVVLDFGYMDNGQWAFLEPNECWAAGIYSSCPTRCLEVIEASQVDKVIEPLVLDRTI